MGNHISFFVNKVFLEKKIFGKKSLLGKDGPYSFPFPNRCPFGNSCMSPLMLRQIWSLVEVTQTQVLLNLDDDSLVQWLLRQLKNQRSLDSQETVLFYNYIQSRLPLIRDLAQSRRIAV
jgi:hypothetical protein